MAKSADSLPSHHGLSNAGEAELPYGDTAEEAKKQKLELDE